MDVKNIREYNSLGDTIITKPVVLSKEEGGIHIPDEYQDSRQFEIIGFGLKFDADDLELGDIVLVAGKGGDRIDLQDGVYWIFPTDMVIAKMVE